MPRKKTVISDEQPAETLTAAETGGAEDASQFPDTAPGDDETISSGDKAGEALSVASVSADGEPPAGAPSGDSACEDVPPGDAILAGDGAPFPGAGDAVPPAQQDMGLESDSPEYGALLQEFGEMNHGEPGADAPLILDPPPSEGLPEGGAPLDEPAQSQGPRGRPRRAVSAASSPDPRRDRVLTIEARDEVQTTEEREAVIWHEIQNAHWTRRILTGTLDGVERTESGMTVAVASYKGFRVVIPVKEMLLFAGHTPSGYEFEELMSRMRGILTARLGSEIDFMVKGHENKSRSVVASRKDAMYRKRQTFYLDKDERGEPMIYEGRVVQARVVAVAEKVVRVEVFGVECPIVARGLSRAWIGDAADHYHVGDRILVRVRKITGSTVEDLAITADARSASDNGADTENLKKCVRQGRYAGRVTDVRGGVLFVRLNNGVNAIAHSCYDRRTPGKGDDVSFSVTRLDEMQGVAVGIITRVIKQNL